MVIYTCTRPVHGLCRSCTRPCTRIVMNTCRILIRSCTRPVDGHVRVVFTCTKPYTRSCTGQVYGRVRRPYTYTAMYTVVSVYAVSVSTAVYGRVHGRFLKNPRINKLGGWLQMWPEHQLLKHMLNEYFLSVVISLSERETRPNKNSPGDDIANVNLFTTTSYNTSKYNPLLNIQHDAGRAAASGCGLVVLVRRCSQAPICCNEVRF